MRVDANLSDALKDQDYTADANTAETAEKLMREALGNENLKVRLDSLKDTTVSAMLEVSEESRRMNDMMRMYGYGSGDLPTDETLVLNAANPVISRML